MFFADDSLVFFQSKEEECTKFLDILNIYAKASRQRVNFQKSTITFGKGISNQNNASCTYLTGIYKIGGFGRYLGLPEIVGRNKYDTFSFIQQRVLKKLESWYTKFLSPAGKEVMIKVVASALPTYCMSCFLLPMKLIHKISGAIRKLWWSTEKNTKFLG